MGVKMANVCIACGKKLGLMESGRSLIPGKHELCWSCYSKIGEFANKYKSVVDDSEIDDTTLLKEYQSIIRAIKSAKFEAQVEYDLIEDCGEMLGDRKIELIKMINTMEIKAREDKIAREQRAEDISRIQITTGSSFDGYKILKYDSLISFTSSLNIYSSSSPHSSIDDMYEQTSYVLKGKAFEMGCNAIIGLGFNSITGNSLYKNTLNEYDIYSTIYVTAYGMPVYIEKCV